MKKVSHESKKPSKKSLDSVKINSSINNMEVKELNSTLKWYNDNKIQYYSGKMSQTQTDKGEWKKALYPDMPSKPNGAKWGKGEWSWKNPTHRQQLPNRNGYALITGKISGITVLDFDNTKNKHIKEIYKLSLKYSNMMATTKENHEHFYFKYHPDIKTNKSPKDDNDNSLYEFDTRNDNGLIYAEPSFYRDRNDDMNEVKYTFMKLPEKIEYLNPIPDDLINLIKKLDNRYINDPIFINDDDEPPKKKEKKKIEVIETDEEEEDNKVVHKCDIKTMSLLKCLSKKRCDDYDEWIQIGMALKAEGDFFNEFDVWSKNSKSYDSKSIKTFWDGFNNNNNKQLKLKSIKEKAKKDNLELFNEWDTKYDDFYKNLKDLSHADWATIYYEENKNKYVVSKDKEWFEYNQYNVLINQRGVPSSLLNDITDTTRKYLIEKRNKLLPPNGNDKEKMNEYNTNQKLIGKFYISLGTCSYVKGIIEYLENLYLNIRLDDLIDNNINVLAFDDKLYDMTQKQFRNIMPDDYITKTTKTKAPTKKDDEEFKKIDKLLLSVFGTQDQVDYWLKITALSLFTNKYSSLYLLQGSGGNGKGLLGNILLKILGDYMYVASNTFLSEKIKGGQANSTLAKCKGVRYLLVSEPDDGTNETEFNVEFIKMITGNDPITTRDLYKSNMTYYPQFTPFVQCNNKPKLGKLDGGIERRLKIHVYPFKFKSNPDKNKPNEKPIDTSLKNNMTTKFYNNFMLYLINIATANIDLNEIDPPKSNQDETNEYFNENNPVKNYIDGFIEKVPKKEGVKETKIRLRTLYDDYINKGFKRISMSIFKAELIKNDFEVAKCADIMVLNCKLKTNTDFIEDE
jgi:P4 family phage/plasmid primase-like protien